MLLTSLWLVSLDEQLHALFKACGGKKDGKIPRAKFLKLFTQKVEADGEPLAIKDVEALFNAASIDYDYDTFSLHEFMSLMIVIKGTDAEKKLVKGMCNLDCSMCGECRGDGCMYCGRSGIAGGSKLRNPAIDKK